VGVNDQNYNVTVENSYLLAMQEAYNILLTAESTMEATINSAVGKIVMRQTNMNDTLAEQRAVKMAQAKLNVAIQAMSRARVTLTTITSRASAASNNATLLVSLRAKAIDDHKMALLAQRDAESNYKIRYEEMMAELEATAGRARSNA